ncbi:MAG TPA: ATP-binding protein, partial [Acidimicrobiia bacterium]|nr:ATP-binding protein [Acidimicrobiia bacterium]
MTDVATLKGRERELASLQRVLDANGPRVAFVYGVAGIGKSALLNAFASEVRPSGTLVWQIDCAAIDPTESSFRAALDAAGWQPGRAGVVLVDTYEMFRIADPWLRHELVPSLSTEQRFVIAGRDAPMLEWSTERGRVGGLEILPLVGLTDEAAQAFLADANVAEDHADMICRIARGHPLSLRLAAEAEVAHMPIVEVGPRMVAALATAFR